MKRCPLFFLSIVLVSNLFAQSFTEVPEFTLLEGVRLGATALADVDGDEDLDLLITGQNNMVIATTKLYMNDGLGHFYEEPNTPFQSVQYSSIAFSDVNNDQAIDAIIAGRLDLNGLPITKLYLNNLVVSATSGLNPNNELGISLYPNPSLGNHINVRYKATRSGFINFKIYDSHGRLIKEQKEWTVSGQQSYTIDISNLPKNLYFLDLIDKEKSHSASFIIK